MAKRNVKKQETKETVEKQPELIMEDVNLIISKENDLLSFTTNIEEIAGETNYGNPSIVNFYRKTIDIEDRQYYVTFSVTEKLNKTKLKKQDVQLKSRAEFMKSLKK